MYVRDARERDAEAAAAAEGSEVNNPGWVHALAEECRELRESNDQLQEEASHLRKETAEIEQKERDLVQQCLTQFGEWTTKLSSSWHTREYRYMYGLHLVVITYMYDYTCVDLCCLLEVKACLDNVTCLSQQKLVIN